VPAPTSATSFVYDDAGHLLGEYDMITGAAVAEYVWLGDLPVAVLLPQGHVDVENEWWTWIDTSSSASPSDFSLGFLQADQLNTPRSMVGEDGFVIWQLDSGGDGSGGSGQIANTNLVPFNLRFSNQYFDQETGLHYNWHRTYDPKTRRYIQSDPVGLSAGPNTYAYVDNAPFDAVDPSGFNPTVLRLTLKLGYETGSALYPVVAPYVARAVDAVLLDPITAHALDPSEVGEDDRGRSGDDAWANVERQVTHDYYKRRCGQQPDDETKKDKCLSAWFFFERDIDCEDLMRAWDAKNKSWLAAKNLLNKHAEAIQNAINGQNNELSRIDRYCGNRKKPKKPQACP
jgi:RHS repeat-associated protein